MDGTLSDFMDHTSHKYINSGGFLLHKSGRIKYSSPEFSYLTRIFRSSIENISFIDLIENNQDKQELINAISDVINGGCELFSLECDLRINSKQSEKFSLEIRLMSSIEEIVSCRITKHSFAFPEIQKIPTQNYLEQIVQNIKCVMWLGSLDASNIYYLSPNFEEMYDMALDEYYKDPSCFLARIHPEDLNEVQKAYNSQSSVNAPSIGFRYLKNDGHWLHVTSYRFIVRDEKEAPYMIAGIAIDDTKLHEAQQEVMRQKAELKIQNERLAETNNTLEDFTALACHDLSQPLRVFSTYTQMLQKDHLQNLDEQGQHLLSGIQKAITRMKDLIQGMADLSRIHERSDQNQACNVRKVLGGVIEPMVLNEVNPDLILEYGNLNSLEANEDHIASLLKNLIENAIKYNENKPHIKVWSKKFRKGVTYAIKDNGIGIPKEAHDKIFSLGHRLPEATQQEGTGIGLTACKKIMSLYRGKIWTHSKSGEGSTFYLFFPFAQKE